MKKLEPTDVQNISGYCHDCETALTATHCALAAHKVNKIEMLFVKDVREILQDIFDEKFYSITIEELKERFAVLFKEVKP